MPPRDGFILRLNTLDFTASAAFRLLIFVRRDYDIIIDRSRRYHWKAVYVFRAVMSNFYCLL